MKTRLISVPRHFAMQFVARWRRHENSDAAASLAFYTLLSTVPLFIIAISVAGTVLGRQAAQGELLRHLQQIMGDQAATMINDLLANFALQPGMDKTFIISAITLFFSGTAALHRTRGLLNRVFEMDPKLPSRPFLLRLASRGISAGMMLVFGIMIVGSATVSALLGYFAEQADSELLMKVQFFHRLQIASSYLAILIGFALLMKILPRTRPVWHAAFSGAFVSAILVASLKFTLDLYLRYTPAMKSIYGGAATVFIMLVWIYLAVMCFIVGAEVASIINLHGDKRRRARRQAALEGNPQPFRVRSHVPDQRDD